MTATRHTCAAFLPLPFATPVMTPVYRHDFGDDPDPWNPPGWAVVAPATADVVLVSYGGPWVGPAVVPAITYTTAGGQYTYTLAGLTAGRTYRLAVNVYNPTSAPVIPLAYVGGGAPPVGMTAPALPAGGWRVVLFDFTPSGTTALLTIGTGILAGTLRGGTLALATVTVAEVAPQAALQLRPTSATVTLDEGWTPYARAVLVCPIPAADVLPNIDPRKPQRVALTLARDGAAALTVAALTAMLAVTGATRTNLTTRPRSHSWTSVGDGTWTAQPLTGPGVNEPNGVDGGSRFICRVVGAVPRFNPSGLAGAAIGPLVASLYLRSSTDQAVRVTLGRGAVTGSTDAQLRAGRWQRVAVPIVVAVAGNAVANVQLLTPSTVGQVIDLTQYQIEVGTAASAYFDGSIGRVGTPPGFPTWTGAAFNSTSTVRYGASLAAHFTAYFTGLTAAYFSDLFADQYNATMDTTLNQSRSFDLGLRARALDYVAGTMTLDLAGDEMLLQDYGRLNTTDPALTPPAGTSLKALVNWALNLIGADLDPSASDAVLSAGDIVWQVGTSLWDFLDGFVRTAGLVLWCDERRRWYLAPPPTGTSGTDTVNALTELDDVIDRDGWADAVVLANTWTDPATGAQTTTLAGQSIATTATYTKLVLVEKINKGVATVAGAGTLLDRMRTRGRRVRVAAVSDYTVTPGHTANLTTPATLIDPCMVSAVVWNLPGDEMALTTKDLP